MTTYEIVGLRSYSFNDTNTGNLVEGSTFFCIYEDEYDDNVVGYKTLAFSLPKRRLGTYLPKIGDKLNISWADKKNYKVDGFQLVK